MGFLPLTYKDNIIPSFIGTFDFLCDVLILKILFSKIHKTKVNFSKFANHYSYFCRCLDKHNIIVCRDVCSSLWMYVAHWYSTSSCGRSISGLIPGILPNILHKVKISGRRADPPIPGYEMSLKKQKQKT